MRSRVRNHAAAGAMHRQMSALRREFGHSSLQMFATTYLPHHFSLPPSTMHVDYIRYYKR